MKKLILITIAIICVSCQPVCRIQPLETNDRNEACSVGVVVVEGEF